MDDNTFTITTVYGPSQDERKEDFIAELSKLGSRNGPVIIGGDFNLVRGPMDKSNGIVDFNWCDKFNNWIDNCGLLELHLLGRKYTWTNNQEILIMSLIDRVFCSTEAEIIFPLASCKALPRNPSDHTPILWESGGGDFNPKKKFRFENWWLQPEDFRELVEKICYSAAPGNSAIDRWQNKVRAFRKKVKGWSTNVEAANRKLKNDLIREFDHLDRLTESCPC